jgi:hypothetical protein
VSGPRNLRAFESSRRARAAIRGAWLGLIRRQPFRRYSARHIRRELPVEFAALPERTIQWHMQCIAEEAERDELPCASRNSSPALPSVG